MHPGSYMPVHARIARMHVAAIAAEQQLHACMPPVHTRANCCSCVRAQKLNGGFHEDLQLRISTEIFSQKLLRSQSTIRAALGYGVHTVKNAGSV